MQMETASCPKCGSTEILDDIPVVSNVGNLSAVAVSALAYNRPERPILKEPTTHRFLSRICGSCGFAEFYVEDPKGLLAVAERGAAGS
jgi:predicted nucleic-acid-binding Zn-ribbon protein